MAIKEIVKDVTLLSDRAQEIDVKTENQRVRAITLDLKYTIQDKGLTCLTAPQIGENARMCCVNFQGDIRTFINPVIYGFNKPTMVKLNCPSLGMDKFYIVPSYNEIYVTYQTPLGKIESNKFVGMAARILNYCVNMLDGVLLSDFGLEIDELWDQATDEEREEVLAEYLKSLDIQQKAVQKEIDSDEEAKKMSDAIKFMEGVATGKVSIEGVNLDSEEDDGRKEDQQ